MPNDQSRPPRLVAGAEALAGVTVEIFVEKHQVAPVRVFGKSGIVMETSALARIIRDEDFGEAPGEFMRRFL